MQSISIANQQQWLSSWVNQHDKGWQELPKKEMDFGSTYREDLTL